MKVDKPEFAVHNTKLRLKLTSCVMDPSIWVAVDLNDGDALVVVGDKNEGSGQYVSAVGLKELAVKLYHLGLWLEQEEL